MKDISQMSVKEYDALVDAGIIVAWTTQEARRVSSELRKVRDTAKPGPLSNVRHDMSGELRDACKKIMAYKLKKRTSRRPQLGGGRGETWIA